VLEEDVVDVLLVARSECPEDDSKWDRQAESDADEEGAREGDDCVEEAHCVDAEIVGRVARGLSCRRLDKGLIVRRHQFHTQRRENIRENDQRAEGQLT
jgi:hypothetical protein